ncbi:MAG: bifunctional UDP-N-acetylglucosamine diphosphorylase/glucosamine-1-phosphate N-acetyltransferase GlmU [Propionibacteriaceae bacterium]|jgi:bifunctional UDP-N-acetylglucosamine pyrophosphorylase/glucosamine-1-phosphate N-acetyltransferase|nr:bifunctional UDP-N-acetylglucosamine diphosphorylase/glucosamine-1-phosphate N-acetyltransferase GlmU [Propionibacteriaceae bacterium]
MVSERDSSVAAVIVLAAGNGTRMKSRTSKLLHTIAGRSLLSWALGAAKGVNPDKLVVVVGYQRDQVTAHLSEIAPSALTAVQDSPEGTGHAVSCGLDVVGDVTGDIVVTYGDVPLLTAETLRRLVLVHRQAGNAVTVMTAVVEDPTGYGRVLRSGEDVMGIVEHRDTDDAQRVINEINSGIYVFDAKTLKDGLSHLTPNNDQHQLYLTDVVAYARSQGRKVGAYVESDVWQTEGVNDRAQLAALSAEMNRRIVTRWMREGVTVVDPATTWIEAQVSIEPDVELWPGTILRGATSIAQGAVIGPDTRLTDVEVGPEAQVIRSEATLAVIGENANVGPFSYLRPGTQLGVAGKIGAFVETKNAQIGSGAKVPHLTYCGDAEIGEGTNVGAGTIFANYDGTNKHHTTVGKRAFIGSDSVIIAPVMIGDDAFVAAGSAIISDVAVGELAVARGRQRNIPEWVWPFRERTKKKKEDLQKLSGESAATPQASTTNGASSGVSDQSSTGQDLPSASASTSAEKE